MDVYMRKIENKQLISSLVRGLNTLDILQEYNEIGVTELSKMLGVNKSNSYRLLLTLEDQGFVEQDKITGKYKLGMKFAKFKVKALDDVELRTHARTYLEKLTRLTNESSGLCVLYNNTGILIDKQTSTATISANLSTGMEEPLYCTSLGKVILSFLPAEQQKKTISTIKMLPLTPKTITTCGQLEAELEKVQEKGFAIDDEEFSLGMRCLAAPIFNSKGEVVASMGISGPISRIRTEQFDEYADIVKNIADELSKKLKYLIF